MALALLTQMSMPPNCCHRLLDGRDHLVLVADVAQDAAAPCRRPLDLLGGGVDGARQLRVRLGGLGGDRDIGAVARGAQRDRQADAAAGAGDEQRLLLSVSILLFSFFMKTPHPNPLP